MMQHVALKHKMEMESTKQNLTKITDILLPSGVSKSRVDLKYILARRITLDLCCRALVPFQIVEKKGFHDFLLKTKIVKCREDIPSTLFLFELYWMFTTWWRNILRH